LAVKLVQPQAIDSTAFEQKQYFPLGADDS